MVVMIQLKTKQEKMASEVDEEINNNEMEIFPYPGKAKSDVWKFFSFLKKTDGPPIKANLDMTTAICRVCKFISNGKKCFSFPSPLLLFFVINATESCLEMLRLNSNYLICVVLSLFYA